MFKRIFILTGVVVFSLVLVFGLLELSSGTAAAVRASPELQAGCIPVTTDITTTQTWTGACYHVMTSTVAIQAGVILTISPSVASTGTLILFDPGARLYVYGSLQALGVPGRSITFTSVVSQARCAWQGIGIDISSPDDGNRIQGSTIEYACTGISIGGARFIQILSNTIRYNGDGGSKDGGIGGITDWANIANNSIYSNSNGIALNKSFYNTIYSNTVHDIDFYGILFVQEAATPGGGGNWITHNDVHDVISGGVRLETGTFNQVLSNSVYLNSGAAIYLLDQTLAEVRYNYLYENGESGYPAALFVTGTALIGSMNSNVISDTTAAAIEFSTGTGGIWQMPSYNALCSVPTFELQNGSSVTISAPTNWWGTNTPTSGKEYTGPVSLFSWITLSLITSTADLPADRVSTSVITIAFRDPVSGATVPPAPTRQTDPPAPNPRRIDLATTLGVISPPVVYVGDDGFVTATLISTPTIGTATISATAFCNYAVSTTVRFAATNLAITKTAIVTQVVLGDALAYRITYSNTSGIMASDVRITDTLPVGTIWLNDTAPALGWTRVQTSPQVVYTRASLPPNPSESFFLTATVASGACGQSLTNMIGIGSRTVEDTLADNTAQDSSARVICADVTITKTTALTQVVPGKLITYTISYRNGGDASAEGVVISDVLPLGTRYFTDTSGFPCPTCATGSPVWTLPLPLPPHSPSYNFNLTLQVDRNSALCGASLTNTVSIATTTPESNILNNSAQTAPLPLVCADVFITKTTPLSRVFWNEPITYTLTFSNAGNASAADVFITDTLPPGSRLVTSSLPCPACISGATDLLEWSVGDLPPAQPRSLTIVLQPTQCGLSLTNRVSITTTTPETPTLNNEASAPPVEVACVDLSIAKLATPPSGTPADPVTFTIVYTNNSNVTLPSFVITDTLPTDTSYVSDTSGLTMTLVPGGLVWNGSNLAPGQPFTFDLRLRYMGATCSQGITLTNRVDSTSAAPETQTVNNTAIATYTIRGGMCADVVVIKNDDVGPTTPNAPLSSDKRDALARLLAPHGLSAHREFVRPGDLVTYTIAVVNHGLYTATQFVLTETMPLNSDYIGYDWAQLDARTFTTSVGTLAPDAGRVYEFVVRVWPDLPGDTRNITNTICGQGAELDLNPEDNCWIEDTPVRPWELRVTKSAPQCVIPGQDLEYTIRYANTMPGTTFAHVPLTDTLSPYVAYLGGGGWNCSSNVCTQSIPTVTAGIHSAGLLGQLNAHFPYTIERGITNTVEISGGDRFTLFTPVYTGADLAVVKNDNVGPLPLAQQRAWNQVRSQLLSLNRAAPMSPYREFVQPGDRITYTILYVNNGVDVARHVVLTETLPVQTQYIGGGWTSVGGDLYTLPLGDLGPHEGGQVHFIVQIDNLFFCRANPLRNRVSIGGDNAECDLSDNWSADHTTISNCISVANLVFLPIILKDYPPVIPRIMFSNGDYSVDEKAGAAVAMAILDHPSSQTVMVDYYTREGTARAGSDYTAVSGVLVFTPGTTSVTFTVPVVDDGVYEGPETVYLWLANALNAYIVPPNPATLTIEDSSGLTCSPMPPSCAPAIWCTLPSAPSPMGMAYENSTERLYIANQGAWGDGNLRRSIALGMPTAVNNDLPGARGVALDRGRNRLYVAGGSSLYVLDGATYARVQTIQVGAGARGVAYNPNSDLIYVTAYEDNSVWVINAETWNVVKLRNFHEPVYVAVNTVTNKVYVSNHTGGVPWGYVTVISGTSEINRVYLSADLYGLAVDQVHNRIYAASISLSRLFVIDGVTDTKYPIDILITRSGGRQVPLRMVAVNPSVGADTHVWLTSSSDDFMGMDKLILLNLPGSNWPPSSPMTLRAVSVAASPEGGLTFDPTSWRVFASSWNSNWVTVSQDNSNLCPTPLSAVGEDDLQVVLHDSRLDRSSR